MNLIIDTKMLNSYITTSETGILEYIKQTKKNNYYIDFKET